MNINQENINFILQIFAILGAFYKLIRIESDIKASIAALQSYLELHKKEHDLLEYKMNEVRDMIEDHHRILKNNNSLNRSSD
jgi:hypothetical protein